MVGYGYFLELPIRKTGLTRAGRLQEIICSHKRPHDQNDRGCLPTKAETR